MSSEASPSPSSCLLQKMNVLQVLRSGEVQGEYIFTMQRVRIYLLLKRAELQAKSGERR